MSPTVLSLLADALSAVHLGFVSFVSVGEVLILLGIAFRWRWIRNARFRLVHLAAISIVALESVLAIRCPLTVWEHELRTAAGQSVEDISFVGRLIQSLLYYDVPEDVFRAFYIGFAVLVVVTFVIAPPRWRSTGPAGKSQAA